MNRMHALILAAAVGALPLGTAAAQDKEDAPRRGPGRAGMMMGRGRGADMAGRVLELRSELKLTERQVEQLTRIQKEYAAKQTDAIQKLRSAQDEEIRIRREREDEVRQMPVEERRELMEKRREEMDEQREEMEKQREERKESLKKSREDRREAMEELRDQRMKEMEKAHPELAKARQDMMKLNRDAAKEIRDVLTEAQEKLLEQRMAERRLEMREDSHERRPEGRRAPGGRAQRI